jgi:NAD(P)-dependent dehydrogenase (short-subunit alcohol dehydrogenase family)
MQLEGRVALVTGGSRGIGRTACLTFAREGAVVAVHYHEQRGSAEAVVAEIVAAGGRAAAFQADVTEPAEVARMMAEVEELAGPGGLHILFTNAGIYPEGSLEEVSVEDWDRVLAINVRGPFLCAKAALPLLKAGSRSAGRARVITIGSVIPYVGAQGLIHYSTAKAAMTGFTHSLARELAEHGITVNCIVPSMVETETARRDYPGVEEWAISQQAIKRYQQPEDLEGALTFLASDASDFMTGQTLVVDGGRVLR